MEIKHVNKYLYKYQEIPSLMISQPSCSVAPPQGLMTYLNRNFRETRWVLGLSVPSTFRSVEYQTKSRAKSP